jgi:hypothetical protein
MARGAHAQPCVCVSGAHIHTPFPLPSNRRVEHSGESYLVVAGHDGSQDHTRRMLSMATGGGRCTAVEPHIECCMTMKQVHAGRCERGQRGRWAGPCGKRAVCGCCGESRGAPDAGLPALARPLACALLRPDMLSVVQQLAFPGGEPLRIRIGELRSTTTS